MAKQGLKLIYRKRPVSEAIKAGRCLVAYTPGHKKRPPIAMVWNAEGNHCEVMISPLAHHHATIAALQVHGPARYPSNKCWAIVRSGKEES